MFESLGHIWLYKESRSKGVQGKDFETQNVLKFLLGRYFWNNIKTWSILSAGFPQEYGTQFFIFNHNETGTLVLWHFRLQGTFKRKLNDSSCKSFQKGKRIRTTLLHDYRKMKTNQQRQTPSDLGLLWERHSKKKLRKASSVPGSIGFISSVSLH